MVTELGVGPVSLCSSLERLALWVSERSPNGTPSACCEDEGAGARDARRTGSSVSISRRCHSRTSRVSLSKASESGEHDREGRPCIAVEAPPVFCVPRFPPSLPGDAPAAARPGASVFFVRKLGLSLYPC